MLSRVHGVTCQTDTADSFAACGGNVEVVYQESRKAGGDRRGIGQHFGGCNIVKKSVHVSAFSAVFSPNGGNFPPAALVGA
jgi:hypothetical protein